MNKTTKYGVMLDFLDFVWENNNAVIKKKITVWDG